MSVAAMVISCCAIAINVVAWVVNSRTERRVSDAVYGKRREPPLLPGLIPGLGEPPKYPPPKIYGPKDVLARATKPSVEQTGRKRHDR